MRTLRMQWRGLADGTPVHGPNWDKRIRWYEGTGSIRVQYTDKYHQVNRFYESKDEASAEVDAFTTGQITCADLIRRNG